MRTELRNEVLRVLEGLSKGEITTMHMGDSKLTFEAISLLKEHRALKEESTSSYRITLSGYDYYQQLKAPRVYWLKQNWFPVGVLFVSSVAPVVSSLMVADLGPPDPCIPLTAAPSRLTFALGI